MKYLIGLVIFILYVGTTAAEKPVGKSEIPAALKLSFSEATFQNIPQLRTRKNFLFDGDSTTTALLINPAANQPKTEITNSAKLDFVLEKTPEFVQKYMNLAREPGSGVSKMPENVYTTRISDSCLIFFSQQGNSHLVAKSVIVDPGANFEFQLGFFYEKKEAAFFSQIIEIKRKGNPNSTRGTLLCNGNTPIGEASKKISAKFGNWEWYKSFLYYPPNEQHVEDQQQRATDPASIQRGTASEHGEGK